MAVLFNQILTVVTLAAATVRTVYGIGCVKQEIGHRLIVQRVEHNDVSDRRMTAYIRLYPTI